MTDPTDPFKKKIPISSAVPPIRPVRGSYVPPKPKPTVAPDDLPPYYPEGLISRTNLIICRAVQKFPIQTQVLEFCKHVVKELRTHFREALQSRILRQDEALRRMRELVRYLLVYNCESESRRGEFEKEISRSEEWLTLVETIAHEHGEAERKVPIPRGQLEYPRSPLKRAICLGLTRKPRSTNRELCDFLDEEGAAELPAKWTNNGDRSFVSAYCDTKRRPDIESMISKVRKDMRNAGTL